MNTPIYKHSIAGLAETVRLGVRGNEIVSDKAAGTFSFRTNAGALARVSGADPVAVEDFVTRGYLDRYLKTQGALRISNEITVDPAGLAAGGTNELRIVTTAAGGTSVGDVYRYDDDAAGWQEVTVAENQTMVCGQTYGPFLADTLYTWDAQVPEWSMIGPITVPDAVRPADSATLAFNTPGGTVTVNSQTLAAGTILKELIFKINEAYDGSAPPTGGELSVAGTVMTTLNSLVDFTDATMGAGAFNNQPQYHIPMHFEMTAPGDVVVGHGTLAGDETAGSATAMLYYGN